jgi:transposase-like protein
MKQSKFSEEQIISILREAEKGEQTITAVCRAHSISENTFYKWRQRSGARVNHKRVHRVWQQAKLCLPLCAGHERREPGVL